MKYGRGGNDPAVLNLWVGTRNEWVTAMHHNLDIFKDPVFWGVLFIGILPIVVGAAVLVESH